MGLYDDECTMPPAGDSLGAGKYAEFSDEDEELEAAGGVDPPLKRTPSKKGSERQSLRYERDSSSTRVLDVCSGEIGG